MQILVKCMLCVYRQRTRLFLFFLSMITEVNILFWVYLWDFFGSGNNFYVLLSPDFFFISFLYLDLYVVGDNSWISYSCKPNIYVS